ncbi:DUF1292 domain-containing protein [Selenomonas bovis]|uniref:DUF1292 domain-containing protein n=1 Tax=Selenomonas bovis TaxID=416586 RepID=UPI00036ACF14|nr:DUF1292 domain-containing protein [Selenomonas bovis]
MADEKEFLEDGDATVIEFTDEDGNAFYYEEEMIIPVGNDQYALLVGLHDEDDHEAGCACGCEDGGEDVLIAKIVTNEAGEEEYVEPTDEEFALVQKAYDALMDEEEGKD